MAHGGAADEVRLTADARVETGTDGVGRYLAGEVDLKRRVDAHHPVIAGDVQGRVHELGGPEVEERVVVEVVVETFAAHGEAGDRLAREQALLLVGDGALLAEIDHPVAEHLGVETEVLALAEQAQDRIRDLSDAELQRGFVVDQRCDVPRDRQGGLIGRDRRKLDQWLVVLDDPVELRDVDEGVAVNARHVAIDLRHDRLRRLDSGHDDVRRDPEAAVAERVGGAEHHEHHVQRQLVREEEPGDLAQEDGCVVGPAVLDGLPHVGADEERVVTEGALVDRVHVGGNPEGEQMDELHVRHHAGALDQRPEQLLRRGAAGAYQDALARADHLDRLLCGGEAALVEGLPVSSHDFVSSRWDPATLLPAPGSARTRAQPPPWPGSSPACTPDGSSSRRR